jgi:diguanylate cyclase (GGDEF)-like protein/PAS domain S-box-containing protein
VRDPRSGFTGRRPPGRRSSERPPRLVLPFALASLALFVATAVGLSQYISRDFVKRQEQDATAHAQFVANSIIRFQITPEELSFLVPMTGTDERQMLSMVQTRVLQSPIIGVKILRSDGVIVFADDTRIIGHRLPVDARLRAAFAESRVVSGVGELSTAVGSGSEGETTKLFETFVPVYINSTQTSGAPAAVIEVDQDYASIQSQVDHLNRTLFYVFSLALALLWVLLLPIMDRISRRMSRQNRKLREAEAKHRAVVEHIPAITYTYIVGDERPNNYVSPQVEALLGITPEEWVADQDYWVKHLHPEDRDRARNEFARCRDSGDPFTEEYRMIAEDGRTVWFRDEFVVIPGESGHPAVVQGVMLDIDDRKRAEEQLAFLAYHDKLTGLPNRHMFEELLGLSLARAKRYDTGAAVIYMDLDDFKLVNDSLGHAAGDDLLKAVAERLQEATRETDLVARQGGDEFLLLMSDMERTQDGPVEGVPDPLQLVAESVAGRVHDALRLPFMLEGTEFYVSASIGISIFPSDSSSAEELLKNADAAMYQSKKAGPGGFLVFSRDGSGSVSKLSLATRLRRAVDRQHWVLHYQPVVELNGGHISGVEALIRWQDPRGGLIAPGEFIPLAEEMGLIEAIGDWVVVELARQSAAWSEMGISLEAAFNLSPRQLWQGDLVSRVLTHLEDAGVDPARIVVEITESAAMTDPDRTQRILWELHGRGVRLAIDDFGTGHSSLSRLKNLPVDILKIDRSFIRDVADDRDAASMVKAIVQLAESLGMVSLAEGIETEEQWRFLLGEGCKLGQGFLFGRPVSAEEITALVSGRPAGERELRRLDTAG